MKGFFTMSDKEINRLPVIKQLVKKEIRQKKAARVLGLSVRQIKRLKKRYQQEGVIGLVHKSRGQESKRKISAEEINRVIEIVKKKYWDFGPTLALEKLQLYHQTVISRETLRKVMIKADLWKPKGRRELKVHQSRERRTYEGELVQIDGSPHAWFENRGPRCDLLGFIDDATSKVKWLEFFHSETTAAYFQAAKGYLSAYGKPLAFYADKNSIFRINASKNGTSFTNDSQGLTQFGRAMKQLGVELIPAHSAPAKGRVEKLFNTLQDRLVKELRLKNISDLKTANQYLPEFMEEFNCKFAVDAKDSKDAHLPLLASEKKNLDKILAFQESRILSKNLTCQFEDRYYQIKTERPAYALRHASVLVIKDLKGQITIEYKDKPLTHEVFRKKPKTNIIDTKELNYVVDQMEKQRDEKIPWKPPANHPWRHASIY